MRLSLLGAACALAVAAAPAMAEPFHHPFGEMREYNRDWLAACPDTVDETSGSYYGTSCFASTGSAEQNGANLPAYSMTLLVNRLTGERDLSFTVAADEIEVDPSRPLVVKFNGEAPESFDFSADLETRYNTINQFYVADTARRDALIARLEARNALFLSVPILADGEARTRELRFSLRGVRASLDFMEGYRVR